MIWRGALANRLNIHPLCLAVPHGDATSMNAALERITERGATQVFDCFSGDKPHFPQPRGDPIDAVDSDDLPALARLQLVKGGHSCRSVIENQSQ